MDFNTDIRSSPGPRVIVSAMAARRHAPYLTEYTRSPQHHDWLLTIYINPLSTSAFDPFSTGTDYSDDAIAMSTILMYMPPIRYMIWYKICHNCIPRHIGTLNKLAWIHIGHNFNKELCAFGSPCVVEYAILKTWISNHGMPQWIIHRYWIPWCIIRLSY